MLLGNPTGNESEEKVMDKDVVFVLDTSGSMRGEKIEQARAAIEYCIGQLNPGDRFNIITFGTDVDSFREAPVPRDETTLEAARDYIEGVIARGRTNIDGALAEALKGQSTPGRPRITIFLTDGTPTAGELVPEKIIERVEAVQPCPTRIFVMGVGHDVHTHLLDRLAEATEGSSQYVLPEEDIDAKIAALYDRLSHPVLTQVAIDFGELKAHSVYPQKLPALFKGSEVMIFGRYREGGPLKLTVSGTLAGEPVVYRCNAELPRKADGAEHEFVAPLWAARKIGYLLQEIRLHGENEELIAEVVKLSRKFGIVTEYTEFLAMTDKEISAEEAVNEANRLVNMANAQKAGKWAFNQARNDNFLQNRKVAGQGANHYLDRLGRVVINEAVRQIGAQTFYLRDGQWIDAEEAGQRNRRVVKLHSDEYNDLVRNDARFARAQQLGWAMEVNVGDERIVVEKDGATQSDALRQVRTRQFEDRQFQQRMMFQQGDLQQGAMQQRGQFNQLQQMPFQQLRNNAIHPRQIQQQLQLPQEQIEQLQQQQNFQPRRPSDLSPEPQERER
jgi:Ca-activated chloride channel family protein